MDDEAVYEARLELIDFLVATLQDEPDEAFVERLLRGELLTPEESVNEQLDEGFDLLESFVAANRDRPVEAVHQELGEEFTRVFVGPRPPVLAHETYYRTDTEFIGAGLAEIEASYAAAGWSPPEDYHEENDHVAVELAFLRRLVERQLAGEAEAVGYEQVFLEEHLERWVGDFVDDLRVETDHELFLAAASLLAGLLEFEAELVAQLA